MQEQLPRVLSCPYPLRFLFASRPAIMGQVLGIVYRVIAGHLIKNAVGGGVGSFLLSSGRKREPA
jgi:hypothetical protein